MSSNTQAPEANAAAPAALTETKVSQSSVINSRVAESIATSNPRVIDAVVNALVKKEEEKRAVALNGALDLLAATRAEIAKLSKPDQKPTAFGLDGKPLGEGTFSKAQVDNLAKAKKKLAKIEEAIEKALREPKDAIEAVAAVAAVPASDGVAAIEAIAGVKAQPAIKPDWSDLFNLKNAPEKDAAAPKGDEATEA